MIGRFIVLQTIGALLLAAGWWAGIIPTLMEADRVAAIPVLGFVLGVGLWCIGRGRMETGIWIANKLPVISMVYTVMGLIMAVVHAQGMDLDAARMQVFTEASFALVANMCGFAGMFWLELTERVCRENPLER